MATDCRAWLWVHVVCTLQHRIMRLLLQGLPKQDSSTGSFSGQRQLLNSPYGAPSMPHRDSFKFYSPTARAWLYLDGNRGFSMPT